MLVSSVELFKKAQKEKYAIPAFNIENMEMARGVLKACSEENSPVIIETTTSTLNYIAPEIVSLIVKKLVKEYNNIPVVLHLDHGASFELCIRCIKAGYTSVMIDGSKLPYEDNVKLSRITIDYGKQYGIPVECELGMVGGKSDETLYEELSLTDPDTARDFELKTGCSSLAVAIGTAHGLYEEEPKLDFERLEKISSLVNVPIVLHGTSGTNDEDVKKSINLGVCKVNYATDLRVAYTKGVRECLKDESVYDPKAYNKAGMATLEERVKELIGVCGSKNKA